MGKKKERNVEVMTLQAAMEKLTQDPTVKNYADYTEVYIMDVWKTPTIYEARYMFRNDDDPEDPTYYFIRNDDGEMAWQKVISVPKPDCPYWREPAKNWAPEDDPVLQQTYELDYDKIIKYE